MYASRSEDRNGKYPCGEINKMKVNVRRARKASRPEDCSDVEEAAGVAGSASHHRASWFAVV